MDLQFENKIAVVTGSTAGIGLAIASALAQEGATVFLNGRTQPRVSSAVSQIRSTTPKSDVSGIVADLSTEDGANELFRQIPEADILINNLGIFEAKPFDQIPDDEWRHMFEANVMSGVRLSRYYLPKMLNKNWGRIIFISSESAINIPTEMIHYGMTKTAQLAVARGLAEMTVGSNVTVNSVLPGPTRSEGVEEFVQGMAAQQAKSAQEIEEEFFKTIRPTSLLKRFATPEEVAAMVTYIASPLASATNGAALRVDGGVVRSIV